jgi:hypothetical protein
VLSRLQRLRALLDQDEQRDLSALHARDRAIALDLAVPASSPHRQILAWASARDPTINAAGDEGTGLTPLLFLLGGLLGVLACAGALYFEGGERVNVVSLLGLLVGLQLASLLLTLLGMAPGALQRLVGLRGLAEALQVLSPSAAVVRGMRRWLPRGSAALALLGAGARRDLRLYARLRRWTLWSLSQAFAVAFNLGAAACFLLLVVFTDLAFGWSTTLDVAAEPVARAMQALAVPWASLHPEAVPDLELVRASRYFRAEPLAPVDAQRLGRWWPFVFACLLTYGLLPRLVLWAFAAWRRRVAVRWTLLHLPGAQELLHRLNRELVSTHGPAQSAPAQSPPPVPARVSVAPGSGSCSLVAWGDLELDGEALLGPVRAACGLDPVEVHAAAGRRGPAEDQEVLQALTLSRRPVVVAVKSWEPPLSELVDFLQALRTASDDVRPLVVVPLPQPGRPGPDPADVGVWRARLARTGDPWLSVRAVNVDDPA